MITRELKLRLSTKQEVIFHEWLWILTGVFNFGIRKIGNQSLNPSTWKRYSKFEIVNLCPGHSKTLGMPAHCIQGTLARAFDAWARCWRGLGNRPRLKSVRNKLRSIPFPDPIPSSRFARGKVNLPGIGRIRYHKQALPRGKIVGGRVLRRASGWYLQLMIEAQHTFAVHDTAEKVGIDTGFRRLAAFSDGTIVANPRPYVVAQHRLGQAQRGRRNKLVARLNERIANRRKDYAHKLSRSVVQNYAEIYVVRDNLVAQARRFGKSVGDAGIGRLRNYIAYKSDVHGRTCVLVDPANTTKTCSACGAPTGPTGLGGLSVRSWACSACGADWDRDVNSARVILKIGVGRTLKGSSDVPN